MSVDRSKLFQMPDLPEPPKEGSEVPEKSGYTPLVKHLSDQMTVRGPMTISNFMREALMNPKWGYYTQSEVFGREGDFTTSPEVTQMYGELLGVWLAETWARMGSPPQVHLVEMGPGRGTLMADVLRAVRAVRPDFHRSVARLGLLELSERLRGRQEAAIVGAGLLPEGAAVAWHGSVDELLRFEQGRPSARQEGPPLLVVGQEFLDALPVHQFEYTARGWVERLVNVDEHGRTPHHFEFVLSPAETLASRAFTSSFSKAVVGDALEVCPEALVLCEKLAVLLAHRGGAALFVDYGHDHRLANSLRGIKRHAFVHPLQEPGLVDLSIDVNFQDISRHVRAAPIPGLSSSPVEAYGPISQRDLLLGLGIEARLARLLLSATSPQAHSLIAAFDRLVEPRQMGTIYKALCIANKHSIGDRSPFDYR